MASSSHVYIGIQGQVLALDRATGEEVWRTELKGSNFVNVVLLDRELLASTRGELFALDPATGEIRWRNKLKGLGTGILTIAVPGGGQAVLGEQRRREDAAAAAASASAIAASS
jgi:outer membrane protein assembly factor BamB